MFGTKRTLPFWTARTPRVDVERALASGRKDRPAERRPTDVRSARAARALADARARRRVAAEAEQKSRFSEG
ncbi:hypothetical protein [Reyranella sp.]|uniref:hypothetical protein n=1 Tax=Reyranella sp. TaxID=1929291 RepID=UPI003BAD311F